MHACTLVQDSKTYGRDRGIDRRGVGRKCDVLFSCLLQKEEDNLQSLIELTNQVNMEVYRAFHFYNAVFEQ